MIDHGVVDLALVRRASARIFLPFVVVMRCCWACMCACGGVLSAVVVARVNVPQHCVQAVGFARRLLSTSVVLSAFYHACVYRFRFVRCQRWR